MTKKEAIELEKEVEDYFSKVLEEKVEISMALSGKAKIWFCDSGTSISFAPNTGKIAYVRFTGYYEDLQELIEKVKQCREDILEKLTLLMWSYENRKELKDNEDCPY